MNKLIYVIIGSMIGAGIGGGIAYVYLNKKYDVVFEKETESYRSEIDTLRESNYALQKAQANKLYSKKEDFFKNENVADVDAKDVDNDNTSDIDDSDDFDAEPTKKSGEIRFISRKDFDDDDDYEKEYIEYYMGNDYIIQNDEVLDEEEFDEVCGSSAISLLKKDKSLARWSNADDNELYIRNERYGVDYKIVRFHKSYSSN